jgi:alkylation response protein AidB-like acyl-CoA dehydrogenase
VIERSLFEEEHEIFRQSVRRFIEEEIVPHHASWEHDGIVPREIWRKAGEAGLLCPNIGPEYGGPGCNFLFNVVVVEELARHGVTGPGFAVHSDMVATYIDGFGNEEQKKRWLPGMVSGEIIGALAITEPSAGSDVRGIKTRAVRDGDDYVISGQKVYISNGQLANIIVLATKTDKADGGQEITLFLVETDRKGFVRGRNLEKIGLKAQDTSELFFDQVRVPATNILGERGKGFSYLTRNLACERLVQAVRSVAVAEAAIEWTVAYTSERQAFGQRIADFQNTQFKLAELRAQAVQARVFVDRLIGLHLEGKLDPVDAAMAKMLVTELHCRTVDECLQFYGGWGYMWEFPIARAYADARIVKIAGGAVEIMKQIIARDLFKGLRPPR